MASDSCFNPALDFTRIIGGCTESAFSNQVFAKLGKLAPDSPVMINIGANTGYAIVEFFARFSDPGRISPKKWKRMMIDYANAPATRSGHLVWTACGACFQCNDEMPAGLPVAGRATAHALELDAKNRHVLSHLANVTKMPLTVHAAAGGAEDGRGCAAWSALAGFEKHAVAAFENMSAIRHPVQHRRHSCWRRPKKQLFAVRSVDSIMASEGISHVYHLSIDTEGWDAVVLDGARSALKRRRISIVEFEYSARWQQMSRSLGKVVAELDTYGYRCFFLPGGKAKATRKTKATRRNSTLVPLSGTCWRSTFEVYRWSNVVCVVEPQAVEMLRELCSHCTPTTAV